MIEDDLFIDTLFHWHHWCTQQHHLQFIVVTFQCCVPDMCFHPWCRHQMETFSALSALCAGNSQVTGEFPSQRPVTQSFDVFSFLICAWLHGFKSKSWGWWLETPSRSLWHQCNETVSWNNVHGIRPIYQNMYNKSKLTDACNRYIDVRRVTIAWSNDSNVTDRLLGSRWNDSNVTGMESFHSSNGISVCDMTIISLSYVTDTF